jgi:hypothetical protein
MRNKLTLITANLTEFARIKALAWADWESHDRPPDSSNAREFLQLRFASAV